MSAPARLSPDAADVARYVDEIAPLLGLPIPAACREGVVRNLAVLLAAGLLIDDFPVGDAETAPVFRP
jgi:Protein of unknown function (DUF4089)